MSIRILLMASMLAVTCAAQAQIRLPSLPGVSVPPLSQTLGQVDSKALGALSDVRRREIDRLIRMHSRLIDTDPNGQPIVRGEVLAVGITAAALDRSRALGFTIDREQSIASAGIRLTVLKLPPKLSSKKALRALREADPVGLYDYNHIYIGAGAARPSDAASVAPPTQPRIRVGLLDSGVDSAHAAFKGSLLHVWGCHGTRLPDAHGTAVASLLVAHVSAELYAADVFCGLPTGGSVDAIMAAFGWMAAEHVAVINVSLVGPKNVMLEQIVQSLIERGHVIVAAVGNDGPAAPPLYPAAFDGVVGVTGVDRRRRVLIEAERGPQVMFAALGADLEAASLGHGLAAVRGTSYAAPAVSALLAALLPAADKEAASSAIEALAHRAIPLGAPGKDLTYGYGLVAFEDR